MIKQGDDTGAFGNKFITIELYNPNGIELSISRAELICTCEGRTGYEIRKVFDAPEFPLTVNYEPSETKRMGFRNILRFAVYDEDGNKYTCKERYTLYVGGKK